MLEAAESQGLVTRKRAKAFLTESQLRTRLSSKAWVRVFPSVYRVAGAPVTWRQNIEALLLWAGKGAALSHRTAAALHGFERFSEGPLELTSRIRVRPPAGVRLYRVTAIAPCDLEDLEDLTVTNATRTLLDLAATTDSFTLRASIDQALREKKTTLEKLEKIVARSRNRPGVIDLRELLREFNGADGPSESELEYLVLELIRTAGLPKPKVQWRVIAGSKRRRLDLIFADQRVIIEADGYATHSGIDRFEDDRERNNSLAAGGFTVLHWTWRAVHDRPEELIAELYAVLNLRH
jgi:very-short-patch-repair endonuclease